MTSRKKRSSSPPRSANSAPRFSAEDEGFWLGLLRSLGRRTLFVDSCAILDYFNMSDDRITRFLEEELVGDQLITSTYVIAETVRRLAKLSSPHRFTGPSGERGGALACYVLRTWLAEHDVVVICVPMSIFEQAKMQFQRFHRIGCDLTDILSHLIVAGLQQNRILSTDDHFRRLGLHLLP